MQSIIRAKFLSALLEDDEDGSLKTFTWPLATELTDRLVVDELEPARINKCEGGMCFTFRNGNRRLYMETYNDGDIGYCIEDVTCEDLVENQDLNNLDEAVEIIRVFLKKILPV